jgi:hypothetical protein
MLTSHAKAPLNPFNSFPVQSTKKRGSSISYRAKKEAATEVPVEVSLATQEP